MKHKAALLSPCGRGWVRGWFSNPKIRNYGENPSPSPSRKGSGTLLLTCILVLTTPAFAKPDEKLRAIEEELAKRKEQAATLAESEKTTAENLSALQQKLVAATGSLQDKQAEQERLETQLAKLEKDSASRSAKLDESRKRLAELTAALLRLSRLPPEAFLLHEDETADHEHRAMLLRAVLPRLQAETETVARALSGLEELRRKTIEQKRLLDAARQNLEAQRLNLDAMVKTRQGLLQNTSEQRAAMAEKMAALTDEAQNLRQLLEKVSQPAIPSLPPARLQAGLKLPLAGRLIRGYGMRDDYGVASEGLTITAAAKSPIVAPQDGRVVFAGPFRGYGQIVIIQHGGGYHSFLAGFGRIDAEVGQDVKAGEPLGQLPDGDGSAPELYFEWRHGTEPVNPAITPKAARH